MPFAVKLNSELIKRIQDHAREKQLPLNEAVAELLQRALDKD